nr:hypothetical protein [Tanacetum cinerariifolium]
MELWVELKRIYEPDPKDQLWTLTQNFLHAPVEWKLYDLSGVHHLTAKDKEIFMLVEKDYPLRKGLALMMISYKLQVENYSQMAEDLIRKIYNISNTPRQHDPDLSFQHNIQDVCGALDGAVHMVNWMESYLLRMRFESLAAKMAKGLTGRMLIEHKDTQGQSVFTSRAWRLLFEEDMAYLYLYFTKDHKGTRFNTSYPEELNTPYSSYSNKIFWKISNVVPTLRNPRYAVRISVNMPY